MIRRSAGGEGDRKTVITTERLSLILLDARQMRLWADNLPALEKELGVVYLAETVDDDFRQMLLKQAEAEQRDPGNELWRGFWWLIRLSDRTVVGSADFKHPPDERGETEIGYGLGENYRHCGYMTEAVKAMCALALKQEEISAVTAETLTDNIPSQHVLTRCGFSPYRQDETLWWRLGKNAG